MVPENDEKKIKVHNGTGFQNNQSMRTMLTVGCVCGVRESERREEGLVQPVNVFIADKLLTCNWRQRVHGGQ